MTHRPSPTTCPPYSFRDLAMHNLSFNLLMQREGEIHTNIQIKGNQAEYSNVFPAPPRNSKTKIVK